MCKEKYPGAEKYYSDGYPSGPWSRFLFEKIRGKFDEKDFRESQNVDKSCVEEG